MSNDLPLDDASLDELLRLVTIETESEKLRRLIQEITKRYEEKRGKAAEGQSVNQFRNPSF
jgi:hypothetical protein